MGSGRLPAARVVRKQKEKWGGRPQQPHHAAHARTQVRALHRHVAWQDRVRRAVLGPVLLHVWSSRVRRPPTLVPPGGRPLLPSPPLSPCLSTSAKEKMRIGSTGLTPILLLGCSVCLTTSFTDWARTSSTWSGRQ